MEVKQKPIVVVDPGHGGSTGAFCAGVWEDDIVYELALRVVHYLMVFDYRPILTRGREYVSLSRRGKIARQANADMFISLHCNASENPKACGVEAFYVNEGKYAVAAREYAEMVLKSMEQNGWVNRGVKPDYKSQHVRLKVLRDTYQYMPAVLFEMGFITNQKERELLKRKDTLDIIARRIVSYIKYVVDKQ